MKEIKKIFNKVVCVLLFGLFIFIGLPNKSQAIEPKIADILITNNEVKVLLYARLVNGFRPEMESAILAGVPTVFTLELNVYKLRSYIWDKKISSNEIKRTIMYDNLKRTFSIYHDGDQAPVIFPDFESAQKAMIDFNGIVASPMSILEKGENYYLEMKIKIDKVRLPLGMEHIFFFVSFWDFETAWYRQNFTCK
ncbi:MAG: hypothetical protein A2031_09400 [Deltaproteobacteria bacterium RBG_19FT_COMBO_43_11]|nr:MAG: hypothetical protein A2031_09400 [Deltaproteobacteria bacterium RBG_19FT_COMBO_43_11]